MKNTETEKNCKNSRKRKKVKKSRNKNAETEKKIFSRKRTETKKNGNYNLHKLHLNQINVGFDLNKSKHKKKFNACVVIKSYKL